MYKEGMKEKALNNLIKKKTIYNITKYCIVKDGIAWTEINNQQMHYNTGK